MLRPSSIGWCDYSGGDLNVIIRGCNCPVSEGCANCYVERWYERWGREMPEGTTTYPDKLGRLWKAKWPADSHRRGPATKPILFLADFGDLFCEDVDEDFILAACDMMAARDDADWVVLTKRATRMLEVMNYWLDFNELDEVPDHIWLGVSAENQARFEERYAKLAQLPAAIRVVSMEPMLGPIDTGGAMPDWIICGAESGRKRRLFRTLWGEDAYRQCEAKGIPFFYKQGSGLYPGTHPYLRGRKIQEWPR